MMVMGTHLLINLHGCPRDVLERSDVVLNLLNKVVEKANLNKIGESSYQFEPFGVTAVILLSESHISIHTWPEKGSAAVDIFTCASEEQNECAFKALLDLFKPSGYEKKQVDR